MFWNCREEKREEREIERKGKLANSLFHRWCLKEGWMNGHFTFALFVLALTYRKLV